MPGTDRAVAAVPDVPAVPAVPGCLALLAGPPAKLISSKLRLISAVFGETLRDVHSQRCTSHMPDDLALALTNEEP